MREKEGRIVYERPKGKNELPIIRVGSEQVNRPIDISIQKNDRLLRKMYRWACRVGLIEDNNEVCRVTGMPYTNFEVWLNSQRRKMPSEYRQLYVRWWNEVVTKRPPQIAGYLFNLIPADTITWNQTFEEVVDLSKEDRILCVVTERGNLVGVLDYNTTHELLEEDLRHEHISPKNSLERLVKERFIPHNFVELPWDTENSKVFKELRSDKFVVVENYARQIENVIPPFPKILTYAPVRARFVEKYASHKLTDTIAKYHAKYLAQRFVNDWGPDIKVMDVGTGSGAFSFPFARFWRKRYPEGLIHIDAVERAEEKDFERTLCQKVKKDNLDAIIFPDFRGVEDLTIYSKDYDLVVWHLVLPTKGAIETLPAVLKKGGVASFSYYDERTIREINGILTYALAKKTRCVPESSLLSVLKTEVLSLFRFVKKILPSQMERRFTCSHPVSGRFRDASEFLDFWVCASPLICGVLSTFNEYPLLRDRIWGFLLDAIKKRYGTNRIDEEIYVNFVAGRI